ncbi:hypothetical protein B0H13DRAFT_1864438 [Mycena leptocephala]|nr:hypothetical protein B0H13DRAFT_1864438 [Mycena leptocephala]
MAAPIYQRTMQPRPPGRNIPLKIYKGSLEKREDSHGQDLLQVSVVGNVDKDETSGVEEYHLQAASATSTVRIPIPGSIQLVENYAELYPSNRWVDTETYLRSAQTISEACSEALLDHDYTYFMDEANKTWLDNTNYQCRIQEQIAQEALSAETDEIFIRVPISEDEFELVIELFEILTGPKQRRSLLGGRKIFPSLNREENDYISAAYNAGAKLESRQCWGHPSLNREVIMNQLFRTSLRDLLGNRVRFVFCGVMRAERTSLMDLLGNRVKFVLCEVMGIRDAYHVAV